MKKTTYSTGNFIGILSALIVFFCGLVILFCSILIVFSFFGFIGVIIGLLLILTSLGMGGKRKKIWRCVKCGYFFEYKDRVSDLWQLSLMVLVFYLFYLIFSPNKVINSSPTQTKKVETTKIENSNHKIIENKEKSPSTPSHSDTDAAKSETKSDTSPGKIIYKGKDKHGNTIYSDKPFSENEQN